MQEITKENGVIDNKSDFGSNISVFEGTGWRIECFHAWNVNTFLVRQLKEITGNNT